MTLLLIALFIGFYGGVFVMGLCKDASDADDYMGRP